MQTKIINTFFLLLAVFGGFSQDQKPFTLAAQTEPGVRKLMQKTDDGGFYAVVKVKGNESSNAVYEVVRYNALGDLLGKKTFNLGVNDNVLHFMLGKKEAHVLIVSDNTNSGVSVLLKKSFSFNLQNERTDTLIKANIGAWLGAMGKGMVDQTFDYAIQSRQGRSFITPLEYRFYVEESPNGEKVLIYRYDYSQSNLQAHVYMYVNEFTQHEEGIIGVDRGYVSHGFKVNNAGELFIIKSNHISKVAIIKYRLSDKTHQYLYLPPTNSLRTDVKIHFLSDDNLLVVALNKKNGSLLGMTYSYFNFESNRVSNQHYIHVKEDFKKKIIEAEGELTVLENKAFKNYELANIDVDKEGNVYAVIERRDLQINSLAYDAEGVEQLKNHVPKMGQVVTSTVILVKVDDYFHEQWITFFSKVQSSDMTHGLNNASFITAFDQQTGNRSVFYATSRKGVFLNTLNMRTISSLGEISTETILENPDNLTPVLPYCFWDDELKNFIFVGKKGILGKKTYLKKFWVK